MDTYQDTSLEEVFSFTAQDLRENRQGSLSESQAARLRSGASRTLLVVLAVLAGLGFLTLISANSSPTELFLMLSCLTIPALGTFAFTLGTTEAAISPRVVSKVSGQIHLAYGMMGYNPPLDDEQLRTVRHFVLGQNGAYSMIVGDKQFRLNKEEYDALAMGYYVVYFVPTLNRIVSIERIDGEIVAPLPPPALEAGAPSPVISETYDEGGESIRA
jgi:hypothetical protein